MKSTKKLTHYWFVIVSVLSFLVGWGMLAHSLKPIQPAQGGAVNTAALPQLPPIQAFGAGNTSNGGLNLITPNIQSNSGFPMLRTRGS
jgi:hypothetical protein